MVHDFERTIPAEYRITMSGETAHLAIDLLEPIRKTGAPGQIFGEVIESGAQTARVGFLKRDKVIAPEPLRHGIEITPTILMRQEVLPAVQEVICIASGRHAGLYVVIEYMEPVPHTG